MSPHEFRRFLRDLALVLVLTFAICSLVVKFLCAPWVIGGDSMDPTLRNGERVLVDLWSYRNARPSPGEIVLFLGPDGRALVKRVASGPVPRNEVPVPSPFALLEADEEWYWVLGDNHPASLDSRVFGPVPESRFRGRVFWRYWPLGRLGSIEYNESDPLDAGR